MNENQLTVGRRVTVNTGKHRGATAVIEKPEIRDGVKGAVVNFSTVVEKASGGQRTVDKPPEWFPAAHLNSRN